VAVSYDHAHFASGGGFSDVAPLQDWQQVRAFVGLIISKLGNVARC